MKNKACLTGSDAYDMGFNLGWEGSAAPCGEGLRALGLTDDLASAFWFGWQAGVDVAREMIREANRV